MAKNETKNYFSPEMDTGKYDLVGDPEDQSTQRESWGTFN